MEGILTGRNLQPQLHVRRRAALTVFADSSNSLLDRPAVRSPPAVYNHRKVTLRARVRMNHQRLQSYAAIAEVFGAFAIVISLLYAGYEVRRSGTMSSLDATVMLYEREREHNAVLFESPHMAELVILAEQSPDELTGADRLRYIEYQHDFLDSWEMAFVYHLDGILDDEAWEGWNDWFAREMQSRPRFAWEENQHNFTPGPFTAHVDAALGNH